MPPVTRPRTSQETRSSGSWTPESLGNVRPAQFGVRWIVKREIADSCCGPMRVVGQLPSRLRAKTWTQWTKVACAASTLQEATLHWARVKPASNSRNSVLIPAPYHRHSDCTSNERTKSCQLSRSPLTTFPPCQLSVILDSTSVLP